MEELWLLIGPLPRGPDPRRGVAPRADSVLASEGGLGGFEAASHVLIRGVEVLPRAGLVGAGLVGGRVVGEADIFGDATLRSVPTWGSAVAVRWTSRWSALAVPGRLLGLSSAVISTFSGWSSGAGSRGESVSSFASGTLTWSLAVGIGAYLPVEGAAHLRHVEGEAGVLDEGLVLLREL